jgi:hypothetical protein
MRTIRSSCRSILVATYDDDVIRSKQEWQGAMNKGEHQLQLEAWATDKVEVKVAFECATETGVGARWTVIVEIDETVRHGPGTFRNRETGEPSVTEASHAPKTVTVSATAAALDTACGRAIEALESYGEEFSI